MIKTFQKCFILFTVALLLSSCKTDRLIDESRIVIGISGDIESLNPLYAFGINEGYITELLFLPLLKHVWNPGKELIEAIPMLAEQWEWKDNKSSIRFFLRDDVKWTDGIICTVEDVIFSFDAYSDPEVGSKLYGSFEVFYIDEKQKIDIEKTFEVISPFEFIIHFKPGTVPSLFNLDFPLIPKHILEKIPRQDIASALFNSAPVTNSAFLLSKWEKNQSIIIKSNPESFLNEPDNIKEIIFKIIPDYTSRLTQLKRGEIDMIEDIKTDDVVELKNLNHLNILPLKGREYEYLGWNNIDPDLYAKNKTISPNKLFGNAAVRRALTLAINREELLEEYLGNYGQIAYSPVTLIFSDAMNSEVVPYPFDLNKAKELLASEGWKDRNNDGILDKNGINFSFILYIPGGNPRREFAATVIRNNLKAAGIDMKVQTVEIGILIENLYGKKLDAWLASWFVSIPIDLKSFWYSDLNITPLNLVSYQNKKVDKILLDIEKSVNEGTRNMLYKEFQKIIHEDEPVTFLYWVDNITAYNGRIKNVVNSPLGIISNCWKWKVE
jgi:peptide/nickel transport system substrate-binding protein